MKGEATKQYDVNCATFGTMEPKGFLHLTSHENPMANSEIPVPREGNMAASMGTLSPVKGASSQLQCEMDITTRGGSHVPFTGDRAPIEPAMFPSWGTGRP